MCIRDRLIVGMGRDENNIGRKFWTKSRGHIGAATTEAQDRIGIELANQIISLVK